MQKNDTPEVMQKKKFELVPYLKKLGVIGFLFFFLKGLVWIGIFAFGAKGCDWISMS